MDLENLQDDTILVLDRMEEGVFVFESLDNKQIYKFKKEDINGDHKEGDVFVYSNKLLNYDEERTYERRKFIDDLFKSLQ